MQLEQHLRKIVNPLKTQLNLRLVDIQIQGSHSKPVINIFVDNEKGVTLGECAKLTRLIQDELDMDDQFQQNYRLNVSSPGLDRPLVEDWEFQKNIGKNLKVQYRGEEKNKEARGKLVNWDAQRIQLEIKGNIVDISRDKILKAKIQLQW